MGNWIKDIGHWGRLDYRAVRRSELGQWGGGTVGRQDGGAAGWWGAGWWANGQWGAGAVGIVQKEEKSLSVWLIQELLVPELWIPELKVLITSGP